jgi:hypothetical protein
LLCWCSNATNRVARPVVATMFHRRHDRDGTVRRRQWRQLGHAGALGYDFIGVHGDGLAWHACQEGGGGDLAATSVGELRMATTAICSSTGPSRPRRHGVTGTTCCSCGGGFACCLYARGRLASTRTGGGEGCWGTAWSCARRETSAT